MKETHEESLETKIARIDENVKHIRKDIVPKVLKHDEELLVVKILALVALFVVALKHPMVADVFGKMFP